MRKCIVCGNEFPLEDFPVQTRRPDGHTSKCFNCTREYNRKDYANNRPARAGRNTAFKKARKERNRKIVSEYLDTHPCVDCGETDQVVLDFDHVRGDKVNNISNMVLSEVAAVESLIAEIAKCEVRCANDHRRVTARRRAQLKIDRDIV